MTTTQAYRTRMLAPCKYFVYISSNIFPNIGTCRYIGQLAVEHGVADATVRRTVGFHPITANLRLDTRVTRHHSIHRGGWILHAGQGSGERGG